MCPQLVDFDADGHKDMVVGTFEGVAFLVRGSEKGFTGFERILDEKKRPILLSAFWNNEVRKWDNADRSPAGEKYPEDHCISVVAVDWDGDKDFDLLLGAKEGGLYLRRNTGTTKKPIFSNTNERLEIEGKPWMVPGGLTAPRLIDWNKDGLFDLVCGSFDGGVFLYENKGKAGSPKFTKPTVLVPNADKNPTKTAERPTEGSYVDVVDYDGDGDLDLLVGGYSRWSPNAKKLTEKEKAERTEILAKIQKASQAYSKLVQETLKKAGDDKDKRTELIKELTQTKEYKEYLALMQKQRGLIGRVGPKREAFVWLYRRK